MKKLLLVLLLTGCAEKKAQTAHLVIPPECVDGLAMEAPCPLTKDGTPLPCKIKITYHCTGVEKNK